jgi:hypothetical protein
VPTVRERREVGDRSGAKAVLLLSVQPSRRDDAIGGIEYLAGATRERDDRRLRRAGHNAGCDVAGCAPSVARLQEMNASYRPSAPATGRIVAVGSPDLQARGVLRSERVRHSPPKSTTDQMRPSGPRNTPIPTTLKPPLKMLARWGGEFIQSATSCSGPTS